MPKAHAEKYSDLRPLATAERAADQGAIGVLLLSGALLIMWSAFFQKEVVSNSLLGIGIFQVVATLVSMRGRPVGLNLMEGAYYWLVYSLAFSVSDLLSKYGAWKVSLTTGGLLLIVSACAIRLNKSPLRTALVALLFWITLLNFPLVEVASINYQIKYCLNHFLAEI